MKRANAIDSMLVIIASESATIAEFARRADAYNATLSRPYANSVIAEAWQTRITPMTRSEAQSVQRLIARALSNAKRERIKASEQLWGSLCKNINDDNEED